MEKIRLPISRLWVFLFIALGFFYVFNTSAQDISKTNLAHMYDFKAEMFIDYTVVSNDPETIMFLKVMVDNPNDFLDDYTIGYQIKNNYDNQQPPFTPVTSENIVARDEALIFKITIPVTSPLRMRALLHFFPNNITVT